MHFGEFAGFCTSVFRLFYLLCIISVFYCLCGVLLYFNVGCCVLLVWVILVCFDVLFSLFILLYFTDILSGFLCLLLFWVFSLAVVCLWKLWLICLFAEYRLLVCGSYWLLLMEFTAVDFCCCCWSDVLAWLGCWIDDLGLFRLLNGSLVWC